jgi:aspartyl-tRNA(Asn)/glutamyl-tRNA(Gln) amidotransferase subunit B
LPVVVEDALVERLRAELPELPDEKRDRFVRDHELSEYDASVLTVSRPLADFYERVVASTRARPKAAANWIIGDLMGALNREGLEIGESKVAPEALGALLDKIEDGTISGKIAKDVFDAVWSGEGDVAKIIEERALEQISDSASIGALVDQVIAANPDQAEQYRGGKTQVLGFLVGQVMKASQGKANPQQVNAMLRQKLGT